MKKYFSLDPKVISIKRIFTMGSHLSMLMIAFWAFIVFSPPPVFAQTANIGKISANSTYAPQNIYVSPIKIAPFAFTGLGISWHQKIPSKTSAQIQVRFFNENIWSDWHPLEVDIDGQKEADYEYPASFLPVNATTTFQYKVILQSNDPNLTPLVENIEFTYINSGEGKKIIGPQENLVASIAPISPLMSGGNKIAQTDVASLTTAESQNVKILTRSDWGADENLRLYKGTNPEPVLVKEENDFQEKFSSELKVIKIQDKDEKGNLLTWPLQYPEKISKIVVHHTATVKNLDNPKQAIRDIYYWHSITRGWGDIGYNYIIDPQGNIYEGRFGGDSVVGAHAGRGNIGSIGIAILGNYQDNNVPEPVLKSLVALIKIKSKQYNIDPLASSVFRGQNIPNIVGHRDIMSTSCPGEKLFAQLPLIRMAAKTGFKANIIDRGKNLEVNKQYGFSIEGDIPLLTFDPGEKKDITITLKNTGPTSWGPGTFIGLNKDANANNFLIVDTMAKSDPLTTEILPNQTAHFKIKLQAGYTGGLTMIEFFPMIKGSVKVEKYLSLPIQIKSASNDYEVVEINFPKPYLKKNMLAEATISLKNTGNITWKKSGKNKFVLGSDNPRDHVNKILQNPGTRWADLEEEEVPPGKIGHFRVKIKAPAQPGPYRESFTPLIEGLTWLSNKNSTLELFVYEKDYQGQLQADSLPNLNFSPGEKRTLSFQLQNQGGMTWNKQGTNSLLITNKSIISVPNFKVVEDKIDPGQNATVTFDVQAPQKEGSHMLRMFPRVAGKNILARPLVMTLQVKKGNGTVTKNPVPIRQDSVNPSTDQPIRIGLSFKGDPIISADGPFTLEAGGKKIATFEKDQKINVSYQKNQYQITTGKDTYNTDDPPRFSSPVHILRIDNFERRPAWNQKINHNEFRGVLEARWYQNQLHTINELSLENYLKGSGEIDEKQPREKIKAIIILSRTYANFYMKSAEKFPGAPFHLSDDPETSQKYMGYSYEKRSPNTVQAVQDTAGMIVTYQGKLIKTPYFSSDEGRTRSAQEVWGWKDTPYLVSVPDPYCEGKTLQGHGVGLSGCGSLGMAQAGKTYAEIISYYFKGVEISKM